MVHVLTPEKIRDCVKLIAPYIKSEKLAYLETYPTKPGRFAVSVAPMLFEVIGGRWDGLLGYSYGGCDLDTIQQAMWVKHITELEQTKTIIIADISLKGVGDVEVEYHIYSQPMVGVDPEKVSEVPDMFVEAKP
jgi:hypothetical protein